MKKKTLYLVHHSHTDIGYTDRQEKISRYHLDFIKSVIVFLKEIDAGKHPEWQGYRYTCENYWQVEQFLEKATKQEISDFERLINEGKIDFSLNYLNMTELVDEAILNRKLACARQYADTFEMKLDSAMTADINGFSWGYAKALKQNGVNNLYSCLHTHHGMFPLFKKQQPFWWETQDGEKLLVWNGDHYQIGNDFLFVPNSDQSVYYDKDGYTPEREAAQFKETEQRVFDYFADLEREDYSLDFISVMISGIVTDNAPPNPRMMEGINKWNQLHGDQITVELVTLSHFFEILRQKELDLPVYRGDWPDWWADGTGSTPAATKVYRDAQRKYRITRKLLAEGQEEKLRSAEDNLMMFAEHTWGYHSSVGEPWETFVNELEFRKIAYATNAHVAISNLLDDELAELGEVSIQLNRAPYFKILNPHNSAITDYAQIFMKHWETVDDSYLVSSNDAFIEVVNAKTGEVYPSQMMQTAKGKEITFAVSLEAKEELIVRLRRTDQPAVKRRVNDNQAWIGTEQVADIASYEGYQKMVSTHAIQTPFFEITFDHTKGIAAIIDRKTGQNLIREEMQAGAFTGIYEKTPLTTDPCSERRRMGRNRKGRVTERHFSQLKNVELVKDGCVYALLSLAYELQGTKLYTVFLKVYKDSPRIETMIRIQKDCEWAPENLYMALPFTLGEKPELYAQKSGACFRPAIDQLPGTNTDFYLLDNGILFKEEKRFLSITMADTPLLTLGDLASHDIELCSEKTAVKNQSEVYAWLMNNFWETNFKVDLSGFYEFKFDLYLGDSDAEVQDIFETAANYNQGILTFAYNPTSSELGK
ncbi:hypothetical protein IGI37_000458 [Enterococcus sp. AZ194]|uniref:glycoside hydrolase family 38 N-terminal domain-containing protein n=1 Tax=Enterococcus sp. AZ194 TaxID=2774629 RepID=UPI003F262BA0